MKPKVYNSIPKVCLSQIYRQLPQNHISTGNQIADSTDSASITITGQYQHPVQELAHPNFNPRLMLYSKLQPHFLQLSIVHKVIRHIISSQI
jgi:hypothetical protein